MEVLSRVTSGECDVGQVTAITQKTRRSTRTPLTRSFQRRLSPRDW